MLKKEIILFFWILFVFLHIINFTNIPIFEDEAEYLLLAQEIYKNPIKEVFIYAQNGLFPFYGWIVSIGMFLIEDSLVVGRLLNILLASSLIFWVYQVYKLFRLTKTFTLFGIILFISSPIIFLNSRIALLDTTVLVLTCWYIYSTAALLREVNFKNSFFLFLSLTGAIFTKPTAFFGFATVLLLSFSVFSKEKLKNFYRIFIIFSLSLFLWGFLVFFYHGQILRDTGSSISFLGIFERIKQNLWLTFNWINIYYFTFMIIIPLIFLYRKRFKHYKLYFCMIGWIVAFLLSMVCFNQFYYPRHLVNISAPLIILLAGILSEIPTKTRLPLFILVIILQLGLSFKIVFSPEVANIALEDKFGYYENYTSGRKILEIANSLREIAGSDEIIVWTDGSYVMEYGLRRSLINSNIEIQSFRLGEQLLPHEPRSVQKDNIKDTYIVVNRWTPSNLNDMKLIKTFDVSYRHSQYLYKVN